MSQITWQTPAGSLGTIPGGVYYSLALLATADTTVYYKLIAGALPKGMEIDEIGVIKGVPAHIEGVPTPVLVDTVSKFAIRAYTEVAGVVTQIADRTFTLEIGTTAAPAFVTPPGQLSELFDSTLITDLQIEYTGPASTVVTLVSGALPPGLSISTTGVISGLIQLIPTGTNYEFTLQVNDGSVGGQALRAFSIYVWSHSELSADDTLITADNTFITADLSSIATPVLLNTPGSIGTVRSGDYFVYQFNGVELSGLPFRYLTNTNIPGLSLDPNSGFLYGLIPSLNTNQATYSFDIRLQLINYPDYISPAYSFSLTVTGPVISVITWLTPSDLGSIVNGSTSTLYVAAASASGLALQYQLLSGSNSRLPQGLELLPSGEIAGRVSFDTFALDGGTTTFDNNTTTFDLVCTFTVEAISTNGAISSTKTFSITVVRQYQEPYDNLYIQAMPPIADRNTVNSLLQNSDIFQQQLLYRSDDPNFGVATNVTYYHAYGLSPAVLDEYVASLDINHYWKNLTLGPVKVAQAIDTTGTVIYEVVYSEIVDNLVNAEGVSVSKQVTLPYPTEVAGQGTVTTVYPNSLINMRNQVIDTVGQISNILPLWMTCKQANGDVLGFTPAWVIAYAKPGCGNQIAYYIGQDFIPRLNAIDFEVDRYELDNLLTVNWNRQTQQWGYTDSTVIPNPPSLTTFDVRGAPIYSDTVAYEPGNIVAYQLIINDVRVNNIYICTEATTPGVLPTDPAHWTQSDDLTAWINNYDDITTWEDRYNTLATWTYATPPGTIFDGGSMQFTAPVDQYSHTNAYNSYLLFPRRNILQKLPQLNQQEWTGNAGAQIDWVNSLDQPIVFTDTTV